MVKGFEEAGDKYDVIEDGQELRSKPYERIFDTEYYWSVPYIVDVEKYKKTFKTEISDGYIDSLSLTSEIEDRYQVVWAYSSKNKEKDGDWMSDCFQFQYDNLDKFKEFVKKLTDTFITVDKATVFNIWIDMERQIENIKSRGTNYLVQLE